MKIINFVPRKDLSRLENLNGFIGLCKHQLTLWEDVPGWQWDNISWPIYRNIRSIRFTDWEHRAIHIHAISMPNISLSQPILDLAKSYIRYRHTQAPHKNAAKEVVAFRVIEAVLTADELGSDITKFNEKHLNACFDLLRTYAAPGALASYLIDILKRLAALSIITSKAQFWVHPFVGRSSDSSVNGSKASSETKAKKLPDQNALLALAEIFSKGYVEGALDDIDIMVTSIVALMLSVPMRVAEVLRLTTNCLQTDLDKNGQTQYYLNYWVPKINAYDKKAIPATMAPIAIEAIKRLLKITHKARELAKYYEGSPTSFYRHDLCPEIGNYDAMTRNQIADAVGYKYNDSVMHLIQIHLGTKSIEGLTLSKLWNEVVIPEHKKLNPHFPYQEGLESSQSKPPKMSDCLLCFRNFQFHSRNITSPILVCGFTPAQFTLRLNSRDRVDRKNPRTMCIFNKHGYKAVRLKSHSLRHFLNHLAYHAGIKVELIAEWSSRASVNQTFVYVDDAKYLESKARARDITPAPQIREYLPPIEESLAESMQEPHQRTVYGLCLRSWKAGPCNKTFDCLNCSELLMCKGDKIALEMVKKEHENLKITFDNAKKALENGERSATRWMKLTGPYLEKLSQLENILTNPEIPDGSPIQAINCNDFSIEQSIVHKKITDAGLELIDASSLKRQLSLEIIDELHQLKLEKREKDNG